MDSAWDPDSVRTIDSVETTDIVGPDGPGLPGIHEPLLRAITLAAATSDRQGVPRQTLQALADGGLLGLPLQPAALQRELAERLFMADGSLAFCWLQHQLPLRRLLAATITAAAPAAAELRQRWLEPMACGRALAAVAFAHLRRAGSPNPSASAIAGGWRLHGQFDWITAWDIADLVLLCVRCRDAEGDRVVGLLLPAGASGQPLAAGMTLGEPLQLLAMGGTHTRPLRLEGVELPGSQVLFVDDFTQWRAADACKVCRVSPMVFGCIRGAIADLHRLGSSRGDATITTLAHALARECRELRRRAYALMDSSDADSPELRPQHRQLRAQALQLAMRSAQATLIAQAGAAMHSGSAAERRLREASFLLVQAQTSESQRASLDRLARP